MGRVIYRETAGKERATLMRAIVVALRELMKQTEPDQQTRDLAAFVALALEEAAATIDPSVEAWEKRGYWVKADRFRLEWSWTGRLGKGMRQAVLEEDLAGVARTSAEVATHVQDIKVPVRHRIGTPWVGAWQRLQKPG